MSESRSPHGERGLKCKPLHLFSACLGSLPPRGAWIEIYTYLYKPNNATSRSPHGERGLKYVLLGSFCRVR